MHILLVVCVLALWGQFVHAQPILGEIRMFAGNFAPSGWAFCHGQIMAISENESLFMLLGTTYGGDGQETFVLPDLRGRAPMHMGNGHMLAETGGVEAVTLSTQQMPAHNHGVSAATSNVTTQTSPANNVFGRHTLLKPFSSESADTTMNAQTMDTNGASEAHENMPPFLVCFLSCLTAVLRTFN